MENQTVSLSRITIKEEIQQRLELNQECIQDYKDAIAHGANFPPLEVYDDGENLFLADGRHRYEAYMLAGVDTVDVIIHPGGQRDAILHAVGANSDHGLRRTNDDKRKAVTTLLKDEEWRTWSDHMIAEKCLVSQPFVSKVRHELTDNGYQSTPVRICGDGRIIDTSNIGAGTETENEEVSQDDTPDAENEGVEEDDENTEEVIESVSPTNPGNEDINDAVGHSEAVAETQVETPNTEALGSESQDHSPIEDSMQNESLETEMETETLSNGEQGDDDNRDGEEPIEDDDVEALKLKIVELQTLLKEKERVLEAKEKRIKELEDQNKYLYQQIEEYERKELIASATVNREANHNRHVEL
jgi:hypothetical protein